MSRVTDKLKANRTRPAEIEGERVNVRVYPAHELAALQGKIVGNDDKAIAEFLAAQFLEDDGTPVLTPEFLLSDECPQPVFIELAQLFLEVNTGSYKKKPKATQNG